MKKALGLLAAILLFCPALRTAAELEPLNPLIIVNKAVNQAALIKNDQVLEIFPAGTGRTAELTPEGLFTVTVKAVNPYYRRGNIPGGDPRNPLGTRWIGFDALNTDGRIYGIHGTNMPQSVGHYSSNGCIRLGKKDIEWLYDRVEIGTKVLVANSQKDFLTLARELKSAE